MRVARSGMSDLGLNPRSWRAVRGPWRESAHQSEKRLGSRPCHPVRSPPAAHRTAAA
jgi:hypothetical protein